MKNEKVICSVCGGKNSFPVLKHKYADQMEKYPRFCPNPEMVVEFELDGIIQKCKHCGYEFLRIDEATGIEEKMMNSRVYKNPFTAKYQGPPEAVRCYRIAMAYAEMDCRRLAAQWFIYAALLVGDEYPEERKRCYKNAWMLLSQEISKSYVRKNIELYLAYLNVMRLLEMFDCVEEFGNEKKYLFKQMDKRLIETIIWLAKRKDSSYMTYFEMLLLDMKEE